MLAGSTGVYNAGAEVNVANDEGLTALIKAASDGHGTTVHTLVLAGADMHLTDTDGENAYEGALTCGYVLKLRTHCETFHPTANGVRVRAQANLMSGG